MSTNGNTDATLWRNARDRALTLIECVIAMTILSLAIVVIMRTTVAGHMHLMFSESSLRAARVAQQLIEETVAAPYGSGGADRADWGLDDYDGFEEAPGELKDFHGEQLDDRDQHFTRRVSVSAASQFFAELGDDPVDGRLVEVSVIDADGREHQVTRFVPEPASP